MINTARGGSGKVGTEYHHGMLHAATWPYPVKRCVSPATYEVDMFDGELSFWKEDSPKVKVSKVLVID